MAKATKKRKVMTNNNYTYEHSNFIHEHFDHKMNIEWVQHHEEIILAFYIPTDSIKKVFIDIKQKMKDTRYTWYKYYVESFWADDNKSIMYFEFRQKSHGDYPYCYEKQVGEIITYLENYFASSYNCQFRTCDNFNGYLSIDYDIKKI